MVSWSKVAERGRERSRITKLVFCSVFSTNVLKCVRRNKSVWHEQKQTYARYERGGDGRRRWCGSEGVDGGEEMVVDDSQDNNGTVEDKIVMHISTHTQFWRLSTATGHTAPTLMNKGETKSDTMREELKQSPAKVGLLSNKKEESVMSRRTRRKKKKKINSTDCGSSAEDEHGRTWRNEKGKLE